MPIITSSVTTSSMGISILVCKYFTIVLFLTINNNNNNNNNNNDNNNNNSNDNLDEEEVAIVMEIAEVIEWCREDRLPALRNVPKKKLLEETAKVDKF